MNIDGTPHSASHILDGAAVPTSPLKPKSMGPFVVKAKFDPYAFLTADTINLTAS